MGQPRTSALIFSVTPQHITSCTGHYPCVFGFLPSLRDTPLCHVLKRHSSPHTVTSVGSLGPRRQCLDPVTRNATFLRAAFLHGSLTSLWRHDTFFKCSCPSFHCTASMFACSHSVRRAHYPFIYLFFYAEGRPSIKSSLLNRKVLHTGNSQSFVVFFTFQLAPCSLISLWHN